MPEPNLLPPSGLHPHRSQFVIGPQTVTAQNSWLNHLLAPGLWLSYCPTLSVQMCTDANGSLWWLLGLAVSSAKVGEAPQAAIARTPTAHIPTLYSEWSGRWVLLGQDQLHLDASGLLGCFYGVDSNQNYWISSSPALLASILYPDNAPEVDARTLVYEQGISWFPPPQSRFLGIRRVLVSQTLQLSTGQVSPRSLMPPIDPDRRYDENLQILQTNLITTLKNLAALGEALWLGLTAGYDSRLMLALCWQAEIDVTLFTRISPRTAVADRVIPSELAQVCGFPHRIIRSKGYFPERNSLVDMHSAGHVSRGDAEPFIKGIRDGMAGIAFGGHGFAVASGFSNLRSLPPQMASSDIAARQIATVLREPVTSTALVGLQEWVDWARQYPQEHLDWRDRIFIEQRQAGWLSSKEQVYDLTPLQRFPILNSASNYATLLSFPEHQRLNSLLQEELIRRVMPKLLNYPFNAQDMQFSLWTMMKSLAGDAPKYFYRKVRSRMR